jgi:Fe-S-cluster-containing hydrogenase component 2
MQVDRDRCTGCGDCLEVCPVEAISLFRGVAVIDPDTCLACDACLQACPVGAISEAEPLAVVQQASIQPAPARKAAVRQDTPVEVIPSRGLAPWAETALSFVGREILPRFVDVLVAALERRLDGVVQEGQESRVVQVGDDPVRRRRRRRRAGRRD